jgi:hypothetical protein
LSFSHLYVFRLLKYFEKDKNFINNTLPPDKKLKKEEYIKESVPEYVWLIRSGETVSDNVLKKNNRKAITVILKVIGDNYR